MANRWGSMVAATLLFAAAWAQCATITVDPLVRYQEYIGVGGTNEGNYGTLINDMGLSVHRLHLDAQRSSHPGEAAKSKAAGESSGNMVYHIASLWTPPGDMKVGPFHSGNCVDGYNACGGTLDPSKYSEFANWYCGRVQLFRDAGAPLYAVCLQNEPWLPIWYISCTYTEAQYLAMFKAVAPVVKQRFPEIKIMAAEMHTGPSNHEMYLLRDPDAAQYLDILAWHGMAPVAPGDARPWGMMARWWRGRHNIAKYDDTRYRPVWQTENNQICGWEVPGGCTDQFGEARSSFEEACNILCMFRYGHGQVWTNYGLGDLSEPNRYAVFKHFGRYIEPGAEMIECSQDSAASVATVAFHHADKKTLTLVLLKSGVGSASATIAVNAGSAGAWTMSDPSAKWVHKGTVSSGQSITLTGYSVSTIYWENYNPDINGAVRPLDAIGNTGSARKSSVPVRATSAVATVEYYDLQGRILKHGVVPNGGARPMRSRDAGAHAGAVYCTVARDSHGKVVSCEMRGAPWR